MTSKTHDEYEVLADRAERGELVPVARTAKKGSARSRAEAVRLLMDATGADEPEQAIKIATGRPKVGAGTSGPSPVVRARVPEALKAEVLALAVREHIKESDVVRQALAEYISARETA